MKFRYNSVTLIRDYKKLDLVAPRCGQNINLWEKKGVYSLWLIVCLRVGSSTTLREKIEWGFSRYFKNKFIVPGSNNISQT